MQIQFSLMPVMSALYRERNLGEPETTGKRKKKREQLRRNETRDLTLLREVLVASFDLDSRLMNQIRNLS